VWLPPETFVMQKGVANEFWRLTRFSIVGTVATGVLHRCPDDRGEIGAWPSHRSDDWILRLFLVSYIGHLRFTFAAPGRYHDYVLKSAVSSAAVFFLSTM